MAILRSDEIRKLEASEVDKRMHELHLELAKERGNIRIGGSVTSPGRIREIRRTIARIKTITIEKARKQEAAAKTKAVKEVVKK